MEPKFVGVVTGLKPNVVSKPIAGVAGVYVAVVTSKTDPKPIADYTQNKQTLLQGLTSSVNSYMINEALKKNMKLEDFRYKFF